ncbi:hypothetical protein PAPYR_7193 [Paratrimastix pyriformis]|uniref:EamA domain-containing protein n=1 Tax=Paratrimastix pyriformis TaxID=342808 RepID=A0ABQ8UDM8_9EUKA|nr:hypothetical protein PAPYR_7193 [Paratrimastix pyriformis]
MKLRQRLLSLPPKFFTVLAHISCCTSLFLWAGYMLLLRSVMAHGLMSRFDPVIFAFFRMVGSGTFFSVFPLLSPSSRKQLCRKDWKDWLFFILVGFSSIYVNQLTFIAAHTYLPASKVALFSVVGQTTAMLVAFCLRSERFSWFRLGGMLSAVTGLCLLIEWDQMGGLFDSDELVGDLIMLVNVINSGCYIHGIKLVVERVPPLVANMWMSLTAVLFIVPTSLFSWGSFVGSAPPAAGWWSIGYAVLLVSVLGYFMISFHNRHLPATVTALWGPASPCGGAAGRALPGRVLQLALLVSLLVYAKWRDTGARRTLERQQLLMHHLSQAPSLALMPTESPSADVAAVFRHPPAAGQPLPTPPHPVTPSPPSYGSMGDGVATPPLGGPSAGRSVDLAEGGATTITGPMMYYQVRAVLPARPPACSPPTPHAHVISSSVHHLIDPACPIDHFRRVPSVVLAQLSQNMSRSPSYGEDLSAGAVQRTSSLSSMTSASSYEDPPAARATVRYMTG